MSQPQPEKLGRYEITRLLGKGAMGIVYEGRDPNIGRRVAIKTARRDLLEISGQADEMMERFLREARAAGALNHPNIVTVYDADEQDGTAYIAMEYIEGSDLQHSIEQKHRYAPEEVVAICATICDALHHAHERGVVHRDVKPANIMLLPDGTLRVTDFGIARIADSTLTIDGAMIGTPHYMSPEQFMGQKVDGRSDLFSVGVIAYVLLTGERPFPGDALATVMHAVTQMSPIAPGDLNFSISPALNAVVLKALSKNPNQRYQSAAEMAAALRESAIDTPGVAVSGGETLSGDTGFDAEKTVPMTDPPRRVDADKTVSGTAETIGPGTGPGADARAPGAAAVSRKMAYAGAGVAAVAMIGVLAVLLGSLGDGAADAYAVPADAPHFSRLLVHAYLAPDEDYYIDMGEGQLLTDADLHELQRAGLHAQAQVIVKYPDGAKYTLGRLPANRLNVPEFQLPGRPDRFELILSQDGYFERMFTVLEPTKPGDIAQFDLHAGGSNWTVLLCPLPDEE